MGFGVWGLGCGVWGVGCGVWGLVFGVWGLGFGPPRHPCTPKSRNYPARIKPQRPTLLVRPAPQDVHPGRRFLAKTWQRQGCGVIGDLLVYEIYIYIYVYICVFFFCIYIYILVYTYLLIIIFVFYFIYFFFWGGGGVGGWWGSSWGRKNAETLQTPWP